MKTIGIINGPNLNRLGKREPAIYGLQTLQELETKLAARAETLGVQIECFQSNHEGDLIDRIHSWTDQGLDGIVLNAGGLTHTSVALRDAVSGSDIPCVEVHISNIYKREDFRKKSLLSDVCVGSIVGLGLEGYALALRYLAGLKR